MEVSRGARPGVIGLGHERQAPAIQVGDLLGAVLEQHAPVGRLEDVVVADVDLVLARGRLPFRELDGDARRGHVVSEEAVERLRLGRLEQVVVLVVVAEPFGHGPALAIQIVPAVLEHVILEFRAGLDRIAHGGSPCHLALEDGPRADGDLLVCLLVDRVRQNEGGLLQPGQDAQRVPHRSGDPVAVAGLPVRQPEAFRCVHLHVGAQEVRAEVGAVVDHALHERLGLDPLAHEAALHVCEGHDQRVDAPVADHRLELLLSRVLRGVTAPARVIALRFERGHGISSGSTRLPPARSGSVDSEGRPDWPAGPSKHLFSLPGSLPGLRSLRRAHRPAARPRARTRARFP